MMKRSAKNRLYYQSLIILRSSGVVIAMMALFLLTHIVLGYALYNHFKHAAPFLSFANTALQTALPSFICFLFCSYDLASKLRRTNGLERIAAANGERLKTFMCRLPLLLLPAAILHMTVWFWLLIACRIYGVGNGTLFLHLLLAVLLYDSLPTCIAVLLGEILSSRKRHTAYALMVFSSAAVSPVPTRILSSYSAGSFSAASLCDWFCLSVPNTDWIPDSVYGISMEAARWILCLFWICLLTALIMYQYNDVRSKWMSCVLTVLAAAVLLLGVRFFNRQNDAIIYKDDRINGLMRELPEYYNGKILPEEEEAAFCVQSYDIRLKVRADLKAEVRMTLGDRKDLETFKFTLHHGMKIAKVCDGNGIPLDYLRETDYLTVFTDQPEIRVTYSGKLGKYYANYQAVYLPGYTAYYPVPGVHHLWDSNKRNIQPVINTRRCHFDISVDCAQQSWSNLPQAAPRLFSGESSSAGVFAGMQQEVEKENVRYLESPLLRDSERWNVKKFEEQWEMYRQFFELPDDVNLEGKLLVFHPMTVLGFNGSDRYVDDGDVLYFGDLYPGPEAFVRAILKSTLPESSRNRLLYSWFVARTYGSLDDMPPDIPQKPEEEELKILRRDSSNLSEDEFSQYTDAEIMFEELLAWQENRLGSRVFLNKIYRYLQDPEPVQDELDFVYHMDEEQAGND